MQSYSALSDYFADLCSKIKLFSHGRPDPATGKIRKTFFRMNQFEEAIAGQVSGMHFPCLIHESYGVKGMLKDSAERLNIGISLWVLTKPSGSTADAIAEAYSVTETALQQIIRYMLNEYEETEACGPFQNIDISMFSWQAIEGPELNGLYGWELYIRAEQKATAITTYNANDYHA